MLKCRLVAPVAHAVLLSTLLKTVRYYKGAGKSLAHPGRKQATLTEDFEFHISYL